MTEKTKNTAASHEMEDGGEARKESMDEKCQQDEQPDRSFGDVECLVDENVNVLNDLKQEVACRTKTNIASAQQTIKEIEEMFKKSSQSKPSIKQDLQKYLSLLTHLVKINEYLLTETETNHNTYLLFKFSELSQGLIKSGGDPSKNLLKEIHNFAKLLKKGDLISEDVKQKAVLLADCTEELLRFNIVSLVKNSFASIKK